MRKEMIRVLGVVLAACLLAACSSTKKEGAEAQVTDKSQGLTKEEMAAQAHGTAGSEGFKGAAIDDPNSPLSKRIIYFEYDSSDVKADYRPIVEAHAAYLASNSKVLVTLEGHADERGSREYNLALGERRAQAVQKQMVLLGASAGQIRTVSYGEERPADPGHDETAYSKNRRVEIVYGQ